MIVTEIERTRHVGPITAITLPDRRSSQKVREQLAAENYDPHNIVAENYKILKDVKRTPFRVLGQNIAKGIPLSFEESFIGMSLVVAATNKGIYSVIQDDIREAHGLKADQLVQKDLLGPAQTFLTTMAQREGTQGLTAEEVAGMVAASMMDINYRIKFDPYVLETGGMGGDKGFLVNGEKKKVINASTLSGVLLSSIGVPVVKHGSYANTSAVGSTEAIEALGVNIYQKSAEEIKQLFDETNFYFSDAHAAKTIHDLSHSPFMRHETVNHIIGPMTPPVDKGSVLNKIIGVNEGVHPAVIAQAYGELHRRGYQTVGNMIAISGLSEKYDLSIDPNKHDTVRDYMMLDEMSPYHTLLGVVQNGRYIGNFVVSPEDFGVTLDAHAVQTVNTESELLLANGDALRGLNRANSDYLALNAAIGLFTAEYLGREDAVQSGQLNRYYLNESLSRCREAISSGQASDHLAKIVAVSNS